MLAQPAVGTKGHRAVGNGLTLDCASYPGVGNKLALPIALGVRRN